MNNEYIWNSKQNFTSRVDFKLSCQNMNEICIRQKLRHGQGENKDVNKGLNKRQER